MPLKKFSTQIDPKVLKELKAYAQQTDKSISNIVSDAVREYIAKAHVRPAFRSAMNEVLEEHAELLRRLAK